MVLASSPVVLLCRLGYGCFLLEMMTWAGTQKVTHATKIIGACLIFCADVKWYLNIKSLIFHIISASGLYNINHIESMRATGRGWDCPLNPQRCHHSSNLFHLSSLCPHLLPPTHYTNNHFIASILHISFTCITMT